MRMYMYTRYRCFVNHWNSDLEILHVTGFAPGQFNDIIVFTS